MYDHLDRKLRSMTPFGLWIRSCSRGVLACTDYVRMYIFSRATVHGFFFVSILGRRQRPADDMISALCGLIPLLQYTGWCVVVKVVTVLLGVCVVSFICVGLSVCASACTCIMAPYSESTSKQRRKWTNVPSNEVDTSIKWNNLIT